MPTPTKGARLGGSPAHERLMLANLATALFEHDRITTTEAKAKRLRPLAERLITFAKRGDLHARRQVMTVIRDKDVVHKLFAEIGPKMASRPGGYTRIVKTNPRKGDNAPMAVIELVEELKSVVAEAERARGTKLAATKAPTGRTKEIADDAKSESATAAAVAAGADADTDTDDDIVDGGDGLAAIGLADEDAEDAAVAAENTVGDAPEAGAQEAAAEESAANTDAPYGEGSHAPLDDADEAPDGFPIKGNEDSKLYHVPDSPFFGRTVAEVWFATAEDAEAAGFTLPPSQQNADDDEK